MLLPMSGWRQTRLVWRKDMRDWPEFSGRSHPSSALIPRSVSNRQGLSALDPARGTRRYAPGARNAPLNAGILRAKVLHELSGHAS